MQEYYPTDGLTTDPQKMIDGAVSQANESGDVVHLAINDIELYVAPGDSVSDTIKKFDETRIKLLEEFVTKHPEIWQSFVISTMSIQRLENRQSAENRADQHQKKKQQRAAAQARRKQEEQEERAEWLARWSAPAKPGWGPKLLVVDAWNVLISSVDIRREPDRYMVEYAFRMAWLMEEKFDGGHEPTRAQVLETDQIVDCYGFSGSMTLGALTLLIGRWPYGQALLDIYNGKSRK